MWPRNLGYNIAQRTGQPLHNDIVSQLSQANMQREKTLPPGVSIGYEQSKPVNLYLKSAQGSKCIELVYFWFIPWNKYTHLLGLWHFNRCQKAAVLKQTALQGFLSVTPPRRAATELKGGKMETANIIIFILKIGNWGTRRLLQVWCRQGRQGQELHVHHPGFIFNTQPHRPALHHWTMEQKRLPEPTCLWFHRSWGLQQNGVGRIQLQKHQRHTREVLAYFPDTHYLWLTFFTHVRYWQINANACQDSHESELFIWSWSRSKLFLTAA